MHSTAWTSKTSPVARSGRSAQQWSHPETSTTVREFYSWHFAWSFNSPARNPPQRAEGRLSALVFLSRIGSGNSTVAASPTSLLTPESDPAGLQRGLDEPLPGGSQVSERPGAPIA